MPDLNKPNAVIGAGIVGLLSAIWLQRAGLAVVLIDRGAPGEGASFANSGALAPHAFVPVNSPSMARRLPRLLFAAASPLSVNRSYAPQMLPWLLLFLVNCSLAKVRHFSAALHGLLARNVRFALPLFRDSGRTH